MDARWSRELLQSKLGLTLQTVTVVANWIHFSCFTWITSGVGTSDEILELIWILQTLILCLHWPGGWNRKSWSRVRLACCVTRPHRQLPENQALVAWMVGFASQILIRSWEVRLEYISSWTDAAARPWVITVCNNWLGLVHQCRCTYLFDICGGGHGH